MSDCRIVSQHTVSSWYTNWWCWRSSPCITWGRYGDAALLFNGRMGRKTRGSRKSQTFIFAIQFLRPRQSGAHGTCYACHTLDATVCGYVCREQQEEIEGKYPPPTSTKNRLKSFCEVGYTNSRPNDFAAGKRISMEILEGVGLHAWCSVTLKRFVTFSKMEMCMKNIHRLCNVKRLDQDIKSRCNRQFL